jgi:hypothetical protein
MLVDIARSRLKPMAFQGYAARWIPSVILSASPGRKWLGPVRRVRLKFFEHGAARPMTSFADDPLA